MSAEYAALYEELAKQLGTQEWRRKLAALEREACAPLRSERDALAARAADAVRLAAEAVQGCEEAVAEQIRRGNRISELLGQISDAEERAHAAEAKAPTSDQVVILKADYERLIASLPVRAVK